MRIRFNKEYCIEADAEAQHSTSCWYNVCFAIDGLTTFSSSIYSGASMNIVHTMSIGGCQCGAMCSNSTTASSTMLSFRCYKLEKDGWLCCVSMLSVAVKLFHCGAVMVFFIKLMISHMLCVWKRLSTAF